MHLAECAGDFKYTPLSPQISSWSSMDVHRPAPNGHVRGEHLHSSSNRCPLFLPHSLSWALLVSSPPYHGCYTVLYISESPLILSAFFSLSITHLFSFGPFPTSECGAFCIFRGPKQKISSDDVSGHYRVLIHPNTGDAYKDHTELMTWMGTPWPLNVSPLKHWTLTVSLAHKYDLKNLNFE